MTIDGVLWIHWILHKKKKQRSWVVTITSAIITIFFLFYFVYFVCLFCPIFVSIQFVNEWLVSLFYQPRLDFPIKRISQWWYVEKLLNSFHFSLNFLLNFVFWIENDALCLIMPLCGVYAASFELRLSNIWLPFLNFDGSLWLFSNSHLSHVE